jgi:hypothetical protein
MVARRNSAVASLCYLVDTVRPLTSAHFLHGAPGSRAYSACLAGISAALCLNQQRVPHRKWEAADAVAWELVLGKMLPRLRDLQGAAQLLAVGDVKVPQQQQEQEPQQQEAQADVEPDVCPPADLALLMLMAAARTVKAGVNLHCFGSRCSSCNNWHPRKPAGGGVGGEKEGEVQGGSSSSEGGDARQHKQQPSDSCDGNSVGRALSQPAEQGDQSTDHSQGLGLRLKDLDQLEEALDVLLTLVHCLVVGGAWWQQAVSHHPLLLLQVLMTLADVSLGRDKSKACIRDAQPL